MLSGRAGRYEDFLLEGLHNRRTRAGAVGVEGVRTLVGGALEEVMLQRVVGRDARLRVIVQHAQDEVLELEVVGDGMPRLAKPPTSWSARFHT